MDYEAALKQRFVCLYRLDLCRRLGFDLRRVQTRNELLCEGCVDQSVGLDCRLGCMLSKVVEKRGGKNASDQREEKEERVSVILQSDRMVLTGSFFGRSSGHV